MKFRWSRLGGQLGIGIALAGFVLIFLGWNGAGSYDRVPAQFPYLISGGIAGLALVVVGAAFIVVENQRRDRAEVQSTLRELRDAVDRLAGATASLGAVGAAGGNVTPDGLVVAGTSTYHRSACRLVQGKADLPLLTIVEAESRGLRGCRTCGAEELVRA